MNVAYEMLLRMKKCTENVVCQMEVNLCGDSHAHTNPPTNTQIHLHKDRHSLLSKNYKVRWEGVSSDFPLFTSLAESQGSQEDPLRPRFTKAENITHCTQECKATGFDSVWGVKYSCQHVCENACTRLTCLCEDQSSISTLCTHLFKRQKLNMYIQDYQEMNN